MGIKFTAIIGPDGNGYLARCPEVDGASQDPKVVEARSNPKLAVKVSSRQPRPTRLTSDFGTRFLQPASKWQSPASSRALSAIKVCRTLLAHRFSAVIRRGSHVIQRKLTASSITVPIANHQALRIGTLLAIILQARLIRPERK